VLRHVKSAVADPALLIGLDAPDDAAVYRISADVAIVQTVDFFTPVVDDARAWGRITAANALSDVYAMGARPITALNLVGWPRSLDFELLGRVLDGAVATCGEAGVSIVGGHSVDDPEPKFGLAVTGTVHPERIVRKRGGPPGSDLVLTKPLGMGIISSAIKEGRAGSRLIATATEIMATLNKPAAEAMLEVGVAAATDVTGFGLVGHLLEMLAPDVSANLRLADIPILPEAIELTGAGILPSGSLRNIEAMASRVDTSEIDDASARALFDAQTSGGLLIAVSPERTSALLSALAARGVTAASVIGSLVAGDGTVRVRPA
jgi:selenide,water dikinase